MIRLASPKEYDSITRLWLRKLLFRTPVLERLADQPDSEYAFYSGIQRFLTDKRFAKLVQVGADGQWEGLSVCSVDRDGVMPHVAFSWRSDAFLGANTGLQPLMAASEAGLKEIVAYSHGMVTAATTVHVDYFPLLTRCVIEPLSAAKRRRAARTIYAALAGAL